MYLMIREGSSEKNLEELLPLVTDHTYHRCMLVVDDRNAQDLYHEGDVDAVVRKAIRLGLAPIRALQLATIVPASYFRLEGLGGIAPGYWANLLVLDDLKEWSSAPCTIVAGWWPGRGNPCSASHGLGSLPCAAR